MLQKTIVTGEIASDLSYPLSIGDRRNPCDLNSS